MTAHECLEHAWLKGDHSNRTDPIDNNKYVSIRDRIRAKYPYWNDCLVPLGHTAEYSSLRKLHMEKYRIHETYFGKY